MTKKEFIDELIDKIYIIGSKEDGIYTLTLKQAHKVGEEFYEKIFNKIDLD
jgi:hypothetical protein